MLQDTAIVLHYSQYKESSLVIHLFCRKNGVILAHYRHAKSRFSKQGFEQLYFHHFNIQLKPFQQMYMVQSLESMSAAANLKGRKHLCGLYINELVKHGWQSTDACEKLFDFYLQTIDNIASEDESQLGLFLRKFELIYLQESGYGLQFECDNQGRPIEPEYLYTYNSGEGFERLAATKVSSAIVRSLIEGKDIIAWSQGHLNQSENQLKKICRIAISHSLHGYEFKTKKVYHELYGA
jgi:DNA repair protein RecO (recombination protein O)